MIISGRLDLHHLPTFVRCISRTEYALFSRDFCGGRDYHLLTRHPSADYGDIDWMTVEIYPIADGYDYRWGVTLPYCGEAKVYFTDPYGSCDIIVNDDYEDKWVSKYHTLNPAYSEMVELLIKMGIGELSNKWYINNDSTNVAMTHSAV